jgi:multidrug efflux pump subunit AcrA (membrane-fusion protein)
MSEQPASRLPPWPADKPPPWSPASRHVPRALVWLAVAMVALPLLALAVRAGLASPPSGPLPDTTVTSRLVARAQVRPIGQARIATLSGGTIVRLPVQVGDWVNEAEEIARVRGPAETEVITAPWSGTITTLPVHYGDTVAPNSTLATLGDLSRLQVETTDVDEFLIGYLARGQVLEMTVDALDQRVVLGRVRTLALQPQPTGNGDEHYPAVIDLLDAPADLRAGMTVRIDLGRQPDRRLP